MLYHTSAEKNLQTCEFKEWQGTFGEFIFFSTKEYVMTGAEVHFTYSICEDVLNLAGARDLYDFDVNDERIKSIIEDCAELYDIDLEKAHDVLCEMHYISTDDAEKSWETQKLTAKLAKALGFDGVWVEDEQGASCMIDMSKHKNMLEKC